MYGNDISNHGDNDTMRIHFRIVSVKMANIEKKRIGQLGILFFYWCSHGLKAGIPRRCHKRWPPDVHPDCQATNGVTTSKKGGAVSGIPM